MDSVASQQIFKEKQMLKVTSLLFCGYHRFLGHARSVNLSSMDIKSDCWLYDDWIKSWDYYRYVVLLGATIACVGLVVSCMLNEVPVAKYRLGAERRFNIYLATMISTFCVAYYSIEDDAFMEFL